MTDPTYATLSVFSAMSERPGEPGWIVDGADRDDGSSEPFTIDDAIAREIERLFDTQTTVVVQLGLDGATGEFVVLDPVTRSGPLVLTDGRGRYFDHQSRRPVDRTGNRISLAHAEHNARNFAAMREAEQRREMRRAA